MMQMADMKVWAQRSYLVRIRRQSFSFVEHVFNVVALPVEDRVVRDLDFPVGL